MIIIGTYYEVDTSPILNIGIESSILTVVVIGE